MIDKGSAEKNGFKTIDSGSVLKREKSATLLQLKTLLPNIVNNDNQLDADALKDFLGLANTTSNDKGYELTFAGKGIARALADTPTAYELKVEKKQSKDFQDTSNVVIRGDNLEVLKILRQNYHNKIKMIYIDPPYNTQSDEFLYKDDFRKSKEELIEIWGLSEDTADFLHNVYGTRSHSGWLSFIYPRLKLARDLLTDDGVIFISIDDNEQANLRIMCDEIFGEENFVANLIWANKEGGGGSDKVLFMKKHEYILCYSCKIEKVKINKVPIDDEVRYKGKDKHLQRRGKYQLVKLVAGSFNYVKSLDFPIEAPDSSQVVPNPSGGKEKRWRWGKSKVEWGVKKDFIEIKKDRHGDWQVYTKQYLKVNNKDELDIRKTPPRGIIGKYSNTQASRKLEEVFNRKKIFVYSKPYQLIKHLIEIGTNEGDVVLDFFTGSGTTGDAVMQLNTEDGGQRKFILVQLDEPIDERKNTESYKFCIEKKMDPVISSIMLERLRRAGDKILAENRASKEPKDLLGLDIGYKVFSLQERPKIEGGGGGGSLFGITNPRQSTLDTLVNMLCATCKTLDTKIKCIIENKLYRANDEIYLLGNIESEKLAEYANLKINIDGWADINLQQYLNLGIRQKENITVIY